jgi:outer membrane cobalamin receptor
MPAPARADSGDDVTEVQVSGARLGVPGQTGTSVTSVSRRDVQSLPGGTAQPLTQVMLTQPGFAPDSFGPDGTVHIRGAESGVLYVVDGIQLPRGLSGQFVDVLPTGLVENLRLITGGQPVEYGPNAGGVVDVATRHGTPTAVGEAQLLYGTYQRTQPSAWYSQSFGAVDVFLSGSYLTTQRGLDTPAASPVLHDALQSGDVFARVDFRPDEVQRLELLARYSQQHIQIPIDPTLLPLSAAPPGAMRGTDAYGNDPPQFVPYDANPTETERDLFVALSYWHTLPGGSLQMAPYIRSSYGDLDCDPARSLGASADPGSACSDVTRKVLHAGETAAYAWLAGESHRMKAGFSFDAARSDVSYSQFTQGDASPLSGRDHTDMTLAGAFLQDEITVGAMKLFPGVRFDVQNASYAGTASPDLLLAGPSARLGFSYAFSKEVVLHGFAGYLWQPPNAVDAVVASRILVPNLPPVGSSDLLKAERDEAAELGVTYRAPRCFEATLTGYGRLAQDQLDVLTVGSTNLVADYNYREGRALGAELSFHATATSYLRGFGNVGWNLGQGKGIDSERYLFSADDFRYTGWNILDHVQSWTASAGFDLHDEKEQSHLSVLFQYGSGLRTGPNNNETVPGHSTWNMTLRHRFDVPLHPELAVDVLNAFDAVYAIRIANGFVGSAYGPLRQVDVRLSVPFGG